MIYLVFMYIIFFFAFLPVVCCSFLKTFFTFQATFFTTYVLTSGWASLSSELMQLFGLLWNFIRRYILRIKEDTDFVFSFPYHTEVPKVLLFGLLGFTCSVLAPLILPFLLVYFFLGYIVYRNQVR
jgi:calcium permeable stress-gated cation channel